ncbi:MAG: DNA adenine methylase, partial [Cytophagales bacterium]
MRSDLQVWNFVLLFKFSAGCECLAPKAARRQRLKASADSLEPQTELTNTMAKARPFIKWVGGKSQLLEQFENYYPEGLRRGVIKKYVEPFLGGGALFFALSERYKLEDAYLSDINKDLVLTYQVIQQRPHDLLDFLEQYQKDYDQTEQEKRNDLF